MRATEFITEKWTKKYKKSINCSNPKGFSQKAHCAGRKARQAGKKTKSSSVSEETAIKLRGFGPSEKTKEFVAKVNDMFYNEGNNSYIFWNHEGNQIPKGKEETKDIAAYVQFELVPKDGNKVEVKWIQATPLRGGYGSKGMQILKDLAQQDGIALTLYPWDKGQVSQSKLIKFYKKQRFNPLNKSKNMIWEPK